MADPIVTEVSPTLEVTGTSVTGFAMFGSGLEDGMTAKLIGDGFDDIEITITYVAEEGNEAEGEFDLEGIPAGVRDLVVTNPGLEEFTLVGAFTVAGLPLPTVTGLLVTSGRSGSAVIVAVSGYDFYTDQTVTLKKSGLTDIVALPMEISGSVCLCTFDLADAPAGWRDIEVNAPTAGTTTVTDAFYVINSAGQYTVTAPDTTLATDLPLGELRPGEIKTLGTYGFTAPTGLVATTVLLCASLQDRTLEGGLNRSGHEIIDEGWIEVSPDGTTWTKIGSILHSLYYELTGTVDLQIRVNVPANALTQGDLVATLEIYYLEA